MQFSNCYFRSTLDGYLAFYVRTLSGLEFNLSLPGSSLDLDLDPGRHFDIKQTIILGIAATVLF